MAEDHAVKGAADAVKAATIQAVEQFGGKAWENIQEGFWQGVSELGITEAVKYFRGGKKPEPGDEEAIRRALELWKGKKPIEAYQALQVRFAGLGQSDEQLLREAFFMALGHKAVTTEQGADFFAQLREADEEMRKRFRHGFVAQTDPRKRAQYFAEMAKMSREQRENVILGSGTMDRTPFDKIIEGVNAADEKVAPLVKSVMDDTRRNFTEAFSAFNAPPPAAPTPGTPPTGNRFIRMWRELTRRP